jgi:hypothetical protein
LFEDIGIKTNVDGHKVTIGAKGATDLCLVSNILVPGAHSAWHAHPGGSLVTVKSGTVTAYSGSDPTCTGRVYTAGQGFLDSGDGHVHVIRNEGTVNVEVIAVQFMPQGATRRIDTPAPGNCPF